MPVEVLVWLTLGCLPQGDQFYERRTKIRRRRLTTHLNPGLRWVGWFFDRFISFVNKLEIGSVIVRNATLDKYDNLFAGKFGSLLEHARDNAYLGMFDFWVPFENAGGYDAFVQSIELTPIQLVTSPLGSRYFNRIGISCVTLLKHRRLPSFSEALLEENLVEDSVVTELNLQNFEIAFGIENALIEAGGVMRSELTGQIDIKNHLRADIEFDAEIPLPAFWRIVADKDLNIGFNGEFGEFTAICSSF